MYLTISYTQSGTPFDTIQLSSALFASARLNIRSFVHQSNNKLLYGLEETKCTIYRNKKIWMYITNGNVMVMKSLNHCYYAANEINFHHIATEHCNIQSTLQIIWLGCVHGNIDETKTVRVRQGESFNCNLNLERARIQTNKCTNTAAATAAAASIVQWKLWIFFSFVFKHRQRILSIPMAQREKNDAN